MLAAFSGRTAVAQVLLVAIAWEVLAGGLLAEGVVAGAEAVEAELGVAEVTEVAEVEAAEAEAAEAAESGLTPEEAVADAERDLRLKTAEDKLGFDLKAINRVGGVMAAKQTGSLIPMCHPLPLALVDVDLRVCENGVAITSKVSTTAETGVEMEALVAVTVSALTIYDMTKALDKGIEIREIVLERKSGGKSGDYHRPKPKKK